MELRTESWDNQGLNNITNLLISLRKGRGGENRGGELG
jgi:hypothetical protein